MAEKYIRWSPYNYVMDNPMRFIDPDGKDVYTTDKDGNIEFKRKTRKDYDKIKVKGTLFNSMKVEKGVLNHKQSGLAFDGKTNVGYNYFGIMGDKEGQGLFEFLAKNTNVEWNRSRFGEGGMSSSILSTSHQETIDAGGSDLLKNNPYLNASDFRGSDHNHPFGEWRPSGSVHPFGDPNRSGDVAMAKMLERKFKGNELSFRIYTANDGRYTNYDSQTFLPLILDEVVITGIKK